MTDVIDLAPFITRIKDQVKAFKVVEGALELEKVMAGTRPVSPAAYVFLREERGADSGETGVTDQVMDALVSVVLLVDTHNDPVGKRAAAELVTLRKALRKALVGWVPDANTGEPVLFERGVLLSFEASRSCWADEFSWTYYYEGA